MAALFLLAGAKASQGRHGSSSSGRPGDRSRVGHRPPADLLVEDGLIARAAGLERTVTAPRCSTRAARSVCPGLSTFTCTCASPATTYKETIETGTRAAAAGASRRLLHGEHGAGERHRAVTDYILARPCRGAVRVYPIGAVTRGLGGKELGRAGRAGRGGLRRVPRDDGSPWMNAELYAARWRYAAVRLPRASATPRHEPEPRRLHEEGAGVDRARLPRHPRGARTRWWRAISCRRAHGAHVHIAHLSTAGRRPASCGKAKARGARVTRGRPPSPRPDRRGGPRLRSHTKMSPPLRTRRDVDALGEGSSTARSTAWRPTTRRTRRARRRASTTARQRVVGLETASRSCSTGSSARAPRSGTLIARMSIGPARLLSLPAARWPGRRPTSRSWTSTGAHPRPATFRSKGRNTPSGGGGSRRSVATIVGVELSGARRRRQPGR